MMNLAQLRATYASTCFPRFSTASRPKIVSAFSANGSKTQKFLFKRTLTTTLYYLEPQELYKTVKPYHLNVPASALGQKLQQSNEVSKGYRNISIQDVREEDRDFTLNQNGFQVFNDDEKHLSLHSLLSYNDYADFATVKDKYRRGVSDFLVQRLGADLVVPFTHEVRRRSEVFPQLPRGTGKAPQPVQGVHVDFTPRWAIDRMRMVLDEDLVKTILKRRWQILNVWRPLFGPLYDWPLALCDWRSIDACRDLEPSDNVYTHVTAETYNVYHHDSHRWYYVSGMQPTETLVFKSFDSHRDEETARVCPHAAFYNPLAPEGARPRESIECLAVVVYPEGTGGTGDHRDEWLP
ncbi:hypothetical protein F5Y12DRAFT_762382 [Xylaria sp. FL1777]|nr:hypothetical protein F5Y12DRAFT_762382 [Xylaria sp. FL1777]